MTIVKKLNEVCFKNYLYINEYVKEVCKEKRGTCFQISQLVPIFSLVKPHKKSGHYGGGGGGRVRPAGRESCAAPFVF